MNRKVFNSSNMTAKQTWAGVTQSHGRHFVEFSETPEIRIIYIPATVYKIATKWYHKKKRQLPV
jgi:hypothetical protein